MSIGRRTYNVVLVWSNLIAPGPTIQLRTRGHVVEPSIPQNRATQSQLSEAGKKQRLVHDRIRVGNVLKLWDGGNELKNELALDMEWGWEKKKNDDEVNE
jgi:hypothetical protein